jgi:predicted Zn-dependent protease
VLAASIAVALAFWGAPQPACQTVAYHVADTGDALGLFVNHGNGYCEVQIKAKRWRFGPLCHVVVHETGHAAGVDHSPDEMSVMFPFYWRTTEICRGKRPPEFPRGAVIELSPDL